MDWLLKNNEVEDAWLGLNQLDLSEIKDNPLLSKIDEKILSDYPGAFELSVLRQPSYIAFTAKCLMGLEMPPFQQVIFNELWTHSFPMLIGSRGLSKSFTLALYGLVRALLYPEYNVILAGASFRQSKLVFEYVEKIWHGAPVLRSMCNSRSGISKDVDRWTLRINDSRIHAIPIGQGGTIRGLRANCTIVDEFASHDPQIVEEVIFGFGAVANNPVVKLKELASNKKRVEFGMDPIDDATMRDSGNQSIISGTADYYFNHFFDYWKRYCNIVKSGGDEKIIKQVFNGEIPPAFNWKDYCVIRIPYEILPGGFMDDKVIARAKSQMPTFLYQKEYGAVFIEDSDGFFKRSLIENCTASEKNVNARIIPEWCSSPFDAVTRGYKDGEYVMGIDPAAENDNLAIVVLENYPDHARIVHSWTTNKVQFQDRRKAGQTDIDDYFHFVVRRIRNMMLDFPCVRIGIDMQGGGTALTEALHNSLYLEEGEEQLWTVIDDTKKRDSDDRAGRHIIEEIQFARADWVRDANYALRKDMESKTLLFPRFDPVSLELALHRDKATSEEFRKKFPGRELVLFDTLEDVVEEIEMLKDELSTIQHSRTGTGVHSRERWTVPDVVVGPEKKTSGKKDRYSALLIANMIARTLREAGRYKTDYEVVGGLVRDIKKVNSTILYKGPDWASGYFR